MVSLQRQENDEEAASTWGGGGGGGVLASSFAGYVPLAILWPTINPILVTFGQMSL